MASITQLQQQLTYARKQRGFAWAKYYEAIHSAHEGALVQYTILTTSADDVAVPEHIKATLKEMSSTLKKQFECPVCMDMIPSEQLEITNCGHYYCKGCLVALKAHAKATLTAEGVAEARQKWQCGVCRRKHGFKSDDE
jgi:transcription elongation factor Elf1